VAASILLHSIRVEGFALLESIRVSASLLLYSIRVEGFAGIN
jgi:hypothetical protein